MTLDFSRYPFLESTLLDNCGVIYLVNNKEMLEFGIFDLVVETERLVDSDENVFVDCRRYQRAAEAPIVRRQIGAAAAD